MKFTSISRVRVQENIVVRIHRNLKGKGTINVRVNQEVSPADIIGTSYQLAGFRIINLAKAYFFQ